MYTIKYPYLVNLSIMTRIVLCIYLVIGFFDFSNFIMKSYNITSYGLSSVSNGCSFLYSLCLLNLFLWQSGYSFIIFFAKFYIFLMMYSSCNFDTNVVALLC